MGSPFKVSLKQLLVLAIPLLLLFTTSCLDVTQHLDVKSDGSALVTSTLLVDNSLLTANGGSIDDALASLKTSTQQADPNAVITVLKSDKQSGLKVVQTYKSVDAALAKLKKNPNATSTSSSGVFEQASHTTSNGVEHYSFVYQPSSTTPTPSPSNQSGTTLPSGVITFHFSLTLSQKIASASGNPTYSDDHHTVTYNLPLDKPTTITIDSEPPFPYLALAIGIILSGLFLLAVAFFFLRRPSKPSVPPSPLTPTSAPSSLPAETPTTPAPWSPPPPTPSSSPQ